VVFGVRDGCLEGAKALAIKPRHEEPTSLLDHTGANGGDLGWRLTLPKDDLRQGITQAAMVVDLGEADVFVRQMTQRVKSGLGTQSASRHFIEERFQLFVDFSYPPEAW
jgi:hypothetical protein